MESLLKGQTQVPQWLSLTKTNLLPKNANIHKPENYRPIALQNNLKQSILNHFITDHCRENDIISIEQAVGQKGSWGCMDQLLMNKTLMEEIIKGRKNALCIWLDYKKAFDSVPHSWLLKSLELAKVPPLVIKAIERLTQTWSTNAYLRTPNGDITTDEIKYRRGILQGNPLSVILFILSANPSSFLLNKVKGFTITPGKLLNHLFFVDDLKMYALSYEHAKLLLDIITTFSNDVGMTFGESKCAYVYIEHGKRKSLGKSIKINGVTIRELEEGEMYTYLGQDESVSFNGPLNKERVRKEYKRRVRKIWSSNLYSNNKVTAHNTFAMPVLTPTIGILNWTKQ